MCQMCLQHEGPSRDEEKRGFPLFCSPSTLWTLSTPPSTVTCRNYLMTPPLLAVYLQGMSRKTTGSLVILWTDVSKTSATEHQRSKGVGNRLRAETSSIHGSEHSACLFLMILLCLCLFPCASVNTGTSPL